MINLTNIQLADFFKKRANKDPYYSLAYKEYADILPGADILKAPGIEIECYVTSVLLASNKSDGIHTSVVFKV